MRSRAKKKLKLNGNEILCLSLTLLCTLGVLMGAIFANNLSKASERELFSYLTGFLQTFPMASLSKMKILTAALIKYGKYICLLFIAGFIPMGALLCVGVIFVKGVSLGFTTAILVKQQGSIGIAISALSFFPQHALILPALIFLGYHTILFSFDTRTHKHWASKAIMKKYITTFAISFALIILSSLIETFLTPYLLQIMLADTPYEAFHLQSFFQKLSTTKNISSIIDSRYFLS